MTRSRLSSLVALSLVLGAAGPHLAGRVADDKPSCT